MGQLQTIEDLVAGTLPPHNNLKIIVRGRPRFIDPQLDGGVLRFASRRGAQFTAMMPDNQSYITEDAPKDSYRLVMEARPAWMGTRCLIRVGVSEALGELQLVTNLIDTNSVETQNPLSLSYFSTPNQDQIPTVSLIGTPCKIFAPSVYSRREMLVESWYQIVPHDILLLSATPDVLQSLSEYEVKRADFLTTGT
jgi:hypothetical protein